MTLLVLGLLLWMAAHLFKRLMPGVRARMGDPGKGLVALTLLAGVVLMVLGYRGADGDILWSLPGFAVHINNLLMLIAIFMFSPAPRKGRLLNNVRHPQLIAMSLWAIAHLLVNGDMESLVLFGGLLVWALLEMVVINRAEGKWRPSETGTLAKDAMFAVASVVLLAVIGYVHAWLGPWPFGG
ncbi:NnrU family protein [Shimia sp.]|uniref:NnrU family protein n=1 Tax=Shimia sp. TaxID=1954381 RepID=UPI00356A0437